jgi:hypothetical protein
MPATDAHEIIRRAVRSGVIVGRDDGSIEVRDIGIASWQPYLLAAGVTDEVVGIIGKPGKLWLPSVTVEPKNPAVINAIVQEVARKNIEDRWNGDGGPMSVVGLPVTDRIELARTENGFRADFRSGTIHTLDTGGIEVVPGDWVRVSWVGLECVMRQEETDEVYGSVFAHGPGRAAAPKVVAFPGGNETYKMGPPGARIILTNELLYEGPLVNLNIGAVLVENDSGDVEEISAEITAKIAQAGAAVIGAMTGVAADARPGTWRESARWSGWSSTTSSASATTLILLPLSRSPGRSWPSGGRRSRTRGLATRRRSTHTTSRATSAASTTPVTRAGTGSTTSPST